MQEKWVVYILECADGSFYTGVARDIVRRLKEHSSGRGSKYVRSRLPFALVHMEIVTDRSRALKREIQIKRLTRIKKNMLIYGDDSL